MRELPDIRVYIEALEKSILGQRLENVRIVSPFLLRTVEPPAASAEGKKVVALRRLGKRICIGVEGEIWLVLHLMIAGRLHWFERASGKSVKLSGRQNRSEEHTSELHSRSDLVCRLLLEKKKRHRAVQRTVRPI